MMSPTGPVPNSSVSSESSSAAPSVEEAQIPGGASSPSPSALLPISALKQPGFEGIDAKYNRAAHHVILCKTGTLRMETFSLPSFGARPKLVPKSLFMKCGCYFFHCPLSLYCKSFCVAVNFIIFTCLGRYLASVGLPVIE